MRTHNILCVTIAAVICVIATPTIEGNENHWEQIPNLNDPDVQEIASWAVAEHARKANEWIQFERVDTGMQIQTVSGTTYKLLLKAVNRNIKEGVYRADVYDEPSTHTRTLEYFAPAL
ncbi:hypothetical protein QYE76_069932 [Lolium multiflorum]|jgi:hypothetical protein|uniref:Cystatin domain-containing protein n=1 Tax=Lolium multiflorum TaxID=4521 RepID=A0AAD8WFE1_LOLMU|nr:hypothetical protein QYE76_069932 [Lolium multiflorum]